MSPSGEVPGTGTSDDPAAILAARVLPTVDDLWGQGWSVDRDLVGGAGDRPGGLLDPDELPDGFPEEDLDAGDAVSFERGGPVLVHAVSAVFTGHQAAQLAWTLLSDESFVEGFLAGLAGDDAGEGDREVLGPVRSLPSFAVDRAGWRAVQHHAAWSVTDGDAVLPISVDMAVLVADRVLMIIWLAGPAGDELEDGWDDLTARMELRVAAALTSN